MKVAYVAVGAEAYVPFSQTPSNIGGSVRVLTRPFCRTFGADAQLRTSKIFPSLSARGRKAIDCLEVAGMRGARKAGNKYAVSPVLTPSPTFASG
jgi:hypothetical protein